MSGVGQRSITVYGPGLLLSVWLIARRAALESLRDRMTMYTSLFMSLLLPIVVAFSVLKPVFADAVKHHDLANAGATAAVYLMGLGMLSSSNAVSIAAGVFAGEKEQGNLAPLLATPVSNTAIFGGKVLGAVIPPLLYSLCAIIICLIMIVLASGAQALGALPLGRTLILILTVLPMAVLGASIASVISSRMRTYQAAQVVSSLVLFPVMGTAFGLALGGQRVGTMLAACILLALIMIDTVIITAGAATWRREEVMARR